MHIAHVYDGHEKVDDGQGSVPSVVWNLARQTATAGHEVTVLERHWNGLPKFEKSHGVAFQRFPLRTGSTEPWTDIPYNMINKPTGALHLGIDRTNFALKAHRRLRTLDPDIVHVHLPFAANILALFAPRTCSQMIYTAHLGETEKRVTNARVSPDVILAKRAARTVVLNPAMREAFEDQGVPTRKLATIPNGVDLDRIEKADPEFNDRLRSTYDLSSDAPTVLFVGTISPRKGLLELVNAAAGIVNTKFPDVQFVLVGKDDIDPAYTQRVHKTIENADLEENFTLTGFVSDAELRGLYNVSDLFVLPSFEEGSSIAISEAMAAGLPIVASAISGVEQQVVHGKHGLLSEPGNSKQLGSYLEELLSDPDQREAMSTAVAERRDEFSWERITDAVISLYQEVLRQ